MQRNQFEKNWNQIKNEVQGRWDRLTDEDLYEVDGMYDQLIHVLTKRYNCSWERAEKEVEEWQPGEEISEWKKEEPPQDWKSKKRKAG